MSIWSPHCRGKPDGHCTKLCAGRQCPWISYIPADKPLCPREEQDDPYIFPIVPLHYLHIFDPTAHLVFRHACGRRGSDFCCWAFWRLRSLSGCLHDPDRTHSRPGGNLLRGRHPATVRKQQFGKYRDRGGRGTLCFPCGTECFDHAHTPHPQRSTRIG